MQLDNAERLAESYESISRELDLSVSATTGLIRQADALLPHGAGWSALHTPASLLHLHYDLARDAEDVGWRAAFLRASDAESFGSGRVGGFVPQRDPVMQKLTFDQLIELIDDDRDLEIPEREMALAELAARASTDAAFASRALDAIGEYQLYTLMERAHRLTYSNGASWLNHEMDYGDRPVWDSTVMPLSILFTQAMKHEDVPPLMEELMTQAGFEAAQMSESNRDFDLDPGRATQLLAFIAGTSDASDVVALRAFTMMNASYESDASAGQSWFSGGFYGSDSPLDPNDHWAIGVKLLADDPLLAARLLDVSQPNGTIDSDVLWDQLLDGSHDAAAVSGDVVATYLLSSPNGDTESWARFSAEFGSGETKNRSEPVLNALAFKWAESPLRAVDLGRAVEWGSGVEDEFLTALLRSDLAFATVTLAVQTETRDMTVRIARGEFFEDYEIRSLWTSYGKALVNTDRDSHQYSLGLIEKAGKLVWTEGLAAIPGFAAMKYSLKITQELSRWLIETGFDQEPETSSRPTPRGAILAFTNVDANSSGPFHWGVADALIQDPETAERFPKAVALLNEQLAHDGGLRLPAADATTRELSAFAAEFDRLFLGAVSHDPAIHEVAGDLDRDGILDESESELIEFSGSLRRSIERADNFLQAAANNSLEIG